MGSLLRVEWKRLAALRWMAAAVAGGAGILLLAAIPIASRMSAARVVGFPLVIPSPSADVAFVHVGETLETSGAWLLDAATIRRVAFLPPPIGGVRWSPDGRILALLTSAGTWGTSGPQRLRFIDPSGRLIRPDFPVPSLHLGPMAWSGDRLVASFLRDAVQRADLMVFPARAGPSQEIALGRENETWGFVGPTNDGSLFVAMTRERIKTPRASNGSTAPMPYGLYRLDLEHGRIEPQPLLEEKAGLPHFAFIRLSPSGRYWVREPSSRETIKADPPPRVLLDLTSGREFPLGRLSSSFSWLEGNRMVWVERTAVAESSLMTAVPPGPPVIVRSWKGMIVGPHLSPDRKRLLVSVRSVDANPCDPADAELLWEPESNRWTELPGWKNVCPFPAKAAPPGG